MRVDSYSPPLCPFVAGAIGDIAHLCAAAVSAVAAAVSSTAARFAAAAPAAMRCVSLAALCSVGITAMYRTMSISVRLVVLSSVRYVIDQIYTQSERAWPLPRIMALSDSGEAIIPCQYLQVLGRSM